MVSPSIEIPSFLRDQKFRFIKLGIKGKLLKAPIEIGWNIFNLEELEKYIEKRAAQWDIDEKSGKHAKSKKKGKYVPRRPKYKGRLNNYSYDDPEFQKWLKQGKNYGVTGAGDLGKLESDDVARWGTLGVMDLLPETPTVQSSTHNRQHFYFCCPDVSDCPLFDPETGEDIGHIRGTGDASGRGGMVVGPGSLHPSGVRYTLIKDVPIACLSKELLEKIKLILNRPTTHKESQCKGETDSRKKTKSQRKRTSSDHNIINNLIKIEDIAMPKDPLRDDSSEIQGSHPLHGSETGRNFSINPGKNTWHCFRCDSGGGPLEWFAVEAGLISCADAGPGCLRGELFQQVLDIARERGYEIPYYKQSGDQFRIIENRIVLEELPEDLPSDPVIVLKGPPRIGKTHRSIKYLIKSRQGNYVTHRHSIVQHAIENFRKEAGQYAVWLEGKHRPGMCRKEATNCADCEYKPDREGYLALKDTATGLLIKHKILTKNEVPPDLCPYYTLKLAEETASYCFTVAYFINDIKQRSLTVLDEDPTLSHFYPGSVELLKIKSDRNEYKFDNTLGKVWGSIQEVKDRIAEKSRPREEDRLLLSAIAKLEAIRAVIDDTRDGRLEIEQCCQKVHEQIEPKTQVDPVIANKALSKLDDMYRTDCTSDIDVKNYFSPLLFPYDKRPVHMLSSGGSGYGSMYLIGDASSPTVNISWTYSNASEPERKVLIIGNTLAELFAKSLGNAVVIEILKFKYARNFVVVAADSGKEDTYRGTEKNQRLKVRKLIKTVAGSPDIKSRHPILALVGSKEHQDWLMRSLGGIAHAAQEEGETGQQWNHRGGYVNIFYQNSTMSRGLDVDLYNIICVHDADYAQPFWSAAIEAGDENAEAVLNSIIMDETTNSVLRISPVVGRGEHHPKIVVIPREDLWKVRYLGEQVLGGTQGGRTPDIDYLARLIVEYNIAGTVQLDGIGSDKCKAEWEEAVKDNKLVGLFRLELDRVKAKGNFTEDEIIDAMNKIIQALNMAGKGKWLSIPGMKELGLKCKNALIRPAIERLYYDGKIERKMLGRKNYWKIKSRIVDR